MGHLIGIREGHSWLAANWAAEHTARLILRFLPPDCSVATQQLLKRVETGASDADLSNCDRADFQSILTASELAYSALTIAGPNSDYFHDPAFYPSFVAHFKELIEALRADERAIENSA